MSYTLKPWEVCDTIDAEAADRRRQQQPPTDDRFPALVLVPATPERLAETGWTAEEAKRLGIWQVLVPEGDGGMGGGGIAD